jgi:agmatinase
LDIPRVNGLSSKALSSLLSVSPNSENYPLLVLGANGIQPHENWKEIKKIHGNVISAEDIHEQGVEAL